MVNGELGAPHWLRSPQFNINHSNIQPSSFYRTACSFAALCASALKKNLKVPCGWAR